MKKTLLILALLSLTAGANTATAAGAPSTPIITLAPVIVSTPRLSAAEASIRNNLQALRQTAFTALFHVAPEEIAPCIAEVLCVADPVAEPDAVPIAPTVARTATAPRKS